MQPFRGGNLKLQGLLLFAAAALTGCASPQGTSTPATPIFSMLSTPEGKVYRVNTTTGDTWLVQGEKMLKVASTNVMTLEIGRKYFIERNRSVTYLGDGKFSDPVPDFSALWN